MLDIVAALRWVHDNIAAFGGDPGNVTIFGQSGGAAKVSTLLAMPSAAGLFHRAIPESGAVLRSLTPDQSRELTAALMKQLGLQPNGIGALQTLPAMALIDAMFAIGATGNPWSTRLNFGPVAGYRSLPRHPFDPDAPPLSADVPIMVGSTHDETRLFFVFEPGFASMTEADAKARLTAMFRVDPARVDQIVDGFRQVRPGLSPADLFIEITTQYDFGRNSRIMAERKALQGRAPAFLYRFDWVSPGPIGARTGAAHATEIPLVFDQQKPTRLIDDTPAGHQMADRMSRVWTQFARTGDPNGAGAGLPPWPAYDPATKPTMILNTECAVVDDPDPGLSRASAGLPDFHP